MSGAGPEEGFALVCPLPAAGAAEIQLAHGGGGAMSAALIETVILPAYREAGADVDGGLHDGAVLDVPRGRLAFTTDAHVVSPHRFPGGDIGELAVNGTVNDLAMCGARPRWLSIAFVVEEGFAVEALAAVARSIGRAARRANVALVTGDTKVVDRGAGDGVFVTTSGIGLVADGVDVHPRRVAPGDRVILSGDIGRHGTAVMSARAGLDFAAAVESDTRPLADAVAALVASGVDVHCLRDATRGGLGTALVEIALAAGVTIEIEEAAVPLDAAVRGVCEVLGLDPFHVANEGRFVAFVPEADVPAALAALRGDAASAGAVVVGRVGRGGTPIVVARTAIGGERVLERPSGEQLPRIC